MTVQAARALLIVVGLFFGLFCLLITFVAGVRLFDRLAHAANPSVSFLLDIGGNILLLAMSICGVVTVIVLNRKGLDGTISEWPYVAPVILVAVFAATMGAALAARQMTWVIPAAILWGVLGLAAGYSVLRKYGLPIDARMSDVVARQRQAGS